MFVVVQYDKNRSGALEFEELRSVLADLGMLVGLSFAFRKVSEVKCAVSQSDQQFE